MNLLMLAIILIFVIAIIAIKKITRKTIDTHTNYHRCVLCGQYVFGEKHKYYLCVCHRCTHDVLNVFPPKINMSE